MLEVRRCLASGAVAGVEWNEEYGRWRYRIDALDVDGDELTAIVVVSATRHIEVVTVF